MCGHSFRVSGFLCRGSELLGGSGVVISRVISPLIWVISTGTLLITYNPILISTHEPPSRIQGSPGSEALGFEALGPLSGLRFRIES